MAITSNCFASVLLNCLLHDILIHDKKFMWKIILPLFTSSMSFPLPYPLFLSSTPIYWFQDFLGKICCPSLSSSSPGFKKCSMLSTFGRTWCYKESLSDNRVSVKHKVYLLMKNCIQTTREHYFLNLILI